MAASKCLSVLLFALFSMALVAARPQEEKQTEISNEIIPLGADTSSSPSTTAMSSDTSTVSVVTTDTSPAPTATPTRSTTFSRIINDIFQIPISVLRAVNNLLNNSFGRSARSS